MSLFDTPGTKARKAALAAEEARRAAEERRLLEARVRALMKTNRAAGGPVTLREKRRWPRSAGFNTGTASFGAGAVACCSVRNRGFGGMQLEFSDDRILPEEFVLAVPTLQFCGIVRCVWNDGRKRGVEVVRWRETV
jgi:hypothetical protein